MPYRIPHPTQPGISILTLHRFAADIILARRPTAHSVYIPADSPEWLALKELPIHLAITVRIEHIPADLQPLYMQKYFTHTGWGRKSRRGAAAERTESDKEKHGHEKEKEAKGLWQRLRNALKESTQPKDKVEPQPAEEDSDEVAAPVEKKTRFAVAFHVRTDPNSARPSVDEEGAYSMGSVFLSAVDLDSPFDEVDQIYGVEK